jgi:histone acetyltransferase (RNA polymerase elongator complex component)
MMIGLPEDTFEKSLKTANDIVRLKANNTIIYPTLVIKDTQLEKLYISGKYKPLNLEQAVLQAKEVYKIFEGNSVNVIRVGLHSSEEFNSGKSLVAGPYHQSFKELVMTEIWLEKLLKLNLNRSKVEYEVSVNKKQYNFAIGFNGKNLKYFYNQGIKLKFFADEKLKTYEINVSNN